MMECINEITSSNTLSKKDKEYIIKMIALCSTSFKELWEELGNEESSVFDEEWPKHDDNMIVDNSMIIAIQVNGKLRGSIEVSADLIKIVFC